MQPTKIKTKEKRKAKTKIAVKKKATRVVGKKAAKSKTRKAKIPLIKIPVTEIITHGEDLYIIPVQGEIHPVRIQEAHQIENVFHHQTEVALHQENQKVKAAMSTRKSAKRFYRNPGRR